MTLQHDNKDLTIAELAMSSRVTNKCTQHSRMEQKLYTCIWNTFNCIKSVYTSR